MPPALGCGWLGQTTVRGRVGRPAATLLVVCVDSRWTRPTGSSGFAFRRRDVAALPGSFGDLGEHLLCSAVSRAVARHAPGLAAPVLLLAFGQLRGDPFASLGALGFLAGNLGGCWPVLDVAVPREDRSQQPDGLVWGLGEPVAGAGPIAD